MTSEEPREAEKPSQLGKRKIPVSDESNNSATESDAERSSYKKSDDSEDFSDKENESEKEDDGAKDSAREQHNICSKKQNKPVIHKPKGMRFSKRLAGIPGHIIPESVILGAKNRVRQRPSINTAYESIVVADSEGESQSGDFGN